MICRQLILNSTLSSEYAKLFPQTLLDRCLFDGETKSSLKRLRDKTDSTLFLCPLCSCESSDRQLKLSKASFNSLQLEDAMDDVEAGIDNSSNTAVI